MRIIDADANGTLRVCFRSNVGRLCRCRGWLLWVGTPSRIWLLKQVKGDTLKIHSEKRVTFKTINISRSGRGGSWSADMDLLMCGLAESWRCSGGCIKKRREVWIRGVEEVWDGIWKERRRRRRRRRACGDVAGPGPTSTCTHTRSSAIQTRKQLPWLNAGAANQRSGSGGMGGRGANESILGGESQTDRGQELNSSPALPPSPPTLANLQILYTRTREFQEEFYIQLYMLKGRWSAAASANAIWETGRPSLWRRLRRQRVRERKGENVSSFRFKVVVGEIWPCS